MFPGCPETPKRWAEPIKYTCYTRHLSTAMNSKRQLTLASFVTRKSKLSASTGDIVESGEPLKKSKNALSRGEVVTESGRDSQSLSSDRNDLGRYIDQEISRLSEDENYQLIKAIFRPIADYEFLVKKSTGKIDHSNRRGFKDLNG